MDKDVKTPCHPHRVISRKRRTDREREREKEKRKKKKKKKSDRKGAREKGVE